MINVACVKFAGMAAGGCEKYIQTIAILLDKTKYNVDFYYTNAAPFRFSGFVHPDNSEERRLLCEANGVKTIPVHVDHKIGNREPYEWVGTNFWEKFDESKYDIVQTSRGGYPEYPFNLINRVRIVDSIHSFTGQDKPNIVKAILLSKWQADSWARNGGNASKMVIIPSLVYVPELKTDNLREQLGIAPNAFVYGMHQGNRDDIYSDLSLAAYSQVQGDDKHFVLLGGSGRHRDQANRMGLKNVHFLDFQASPEYIHTFLNTIDVFAHSRNDGEVCSAAIIEAMYHGKPVITHPALNMGHMEQVEGCGAVVHNSNEYAAAMRRFCDDRDYYQEMSERTRQRYYEKYDYKKVEAQIKELYEEVSR